MGPGRAAGSLVTNDANVRGRGIWGFRAVVVAWLLVTLVAGPTAPAAASNPEAQRVIAIAREQVGDPYVFGATGPDAFDCSGLVYFVFREARVLRLIGGTQRSALGYWRWFAARHRASRTAPRPGDLVVWGRGGHIGIYVGNGRAVSALRAGVEVHTIAAVTLPFTAYLHVAYQSPLPEPTPVPTPRPTPPTPEPTPRPTPPTPEPTPRPTPK